MTTITITHEGKTYTADGLTFSVTDSRGKFIRGWDEGRGVNASRVLGGSQAQQTQAHKHISAIGEAYTGCCGQPNTCEQPCFHASGRTTPGQHGGIASVPQSRADVRSSDGWVTWDGGVMPVTGMVEVRYRNGVTNTDDAASFLWDHRDYPDDIVAYRNAIPAPQYDPRDVSFNPLDRQVGGSHYRDMAIQPVEFIVANNIPYREANVIKYVVRHASKNGKQDLLKARHYIDMLIADYEDAQ